MGACGKQVVKLMQEEQDRGVTLIALTHRDELLRRGGVNGNSIVKVCFGCTHFDGHRESLQHLIAAQALHVQTHHLWKRDN